MGFDGASLPGAGPAARGPPVRAGFGSRSGTLDRGIPGPRDPGTSAPRNHGTRHPGAAPGAGRPGAVRSGLSPLGLSLSPQF